VILESFGLHTEYTTPNLPDLNEVIKCTLRRQGKISCIIVIEFGQCHYIGITASSVFRPAELGTKTHSLKGAGFIDRLKWEAQTREEYKDVL